MAPQRAQPVDWSAARQIGFKKALSEHPGLTVAGSANGGYLRQQGLSATQDLLTRDPDIQAIWGRGGRCRRAGLRDAVHPQRQADREHRRRERRPGHHVHRHLFHDAFLGETVAKIVNVPTRVVDKENVDYSEAYMQWALGNDRKY